MSADNPKKPRSFKQAKVIQVFLWDHLVGATALDPRSGCHAFQYDDQFRAMGIEPSPLRMGVGRNETHIFPDLGARTYQRLPALLSDSLPDRFGTSLIQLAMRDYGIPEERITPLDKLAYIGNRSMGALQFKPAHDRGRTPSAVDIAGLVEAARDAILGDPHGSPLKQLVSVGVSAGGARPKAVVGWNPTTGRFLSGQFDLPEGFEHWLLKFDGVEQGPPTEPHDEGRIEFAYHLMAKAAGVRMSECRLHEEGGRAHFMTRRFDREGRSTRHHVQTLCAMDHMDFGLLGAYSYNQFLDVIVRLGLPEDDLAQAFRRMAFNVMARNLDDHTKNVSFLLKRGEPWRLAPAYDLTFSWDPHGRYNHQHFLSVNGKFDGITRADLLLEAERYSIGNARGILDQVQDAVAHWDEFSEEAGVPRERRGMIGREHRLL